MHILAIFILLVCEHGRPSSLLRSSPFHHSVSHHFHTTDVLCVCVCVHADFLPHPKPVWGCLQTFRESEMLAGVGEMEGQYHWQFLSRHPQAVSHGLSHAGTAALLRTPLEGPL